MSNGSSRSDGFRPKIQSTSTQFKAHLSPNLDTKADVQNGCDKTVGNLLYMVATKFPANALNHRVFLLKYIVSSQVKNAAQLDAALSFLSNIGPESFNENEFEEACGVGVEVSLDEIHSSVTAVLKENMDAILDLRYHFNVGNLCGQVRKQHPWADAKIVKEVIDERLRSILGERTAEDDKKPLKKKKEKPVKVEEKKVSTAASTTPPEEELNPFSIFPQPEENSKVHTEIFFSDGSIWRAHNTKEKLEKHLKSTGGKVLTRFPPEPNGYLHIGHAKAMFINFGLAKDRAGSCYLRFDDTNPEAEKQEYIEHIQEIVQWMGWQPFKVTYTSDYFEDLYNLAVELIRKGRAYVDHQLCTLEFEIRRPSYYWLLEALGLYEPYVWEYSRLNISNTVMSKRKLNRLVTEKWVDGWDDPRLMTLAGLRRRGVSSTSINAFIRGIGITRSDNSLIQVNRLEYHIREELNKTASRTMVVLNPLKVVITNLNCGSTMYLDAKMWPDAPADDPSSFYKVPFTNVVYIERTDFRLKDSKDYYGLAPGKSVLLRYAYPITCTEVIYGNDKETVVEIRAEYDSSKKSKPKGVLHWVAQPSPGVDPLKVEVRLFENLFLSENPAELEDWLADLNPRSKEVISEAYAVPSLGSATTGDRFQFERLGYFAVDPDSTPEKLVFNRTVTLRDSYSKGGNK
ncbi:uncharacterized protein A4U43_C10F2620 [Asparagus officinalis]|uniref:glutamine--tRNA ligase n=1 Tax=Asparagus officinalis TaxID=4686 RepID=A0A5P1E037_ASPOF|nr:uncharacterized protein A4U43_C10F2620 [Asparagus officinalis]